MQESGQFWELHSTSSKECLLAFNKYLLDLGSLCLGIFFQVEYFSSSSRDNAILCKNYNHSKCAQNIVFYAGRKLNARDPDLCKKPCQINTFQVSKSDINAEMQDKDYMGWVEFTIYNETFVIHLYFYTHPAWLIYF